MTAISTTAQLNCISHAADTLVKLLFEFERAILSVIAKDVLLTEVIESITM
jgi:hypothetical protein